MTMVDPHTASVLARLESGPSVAPGTCAIHGEELVSHRRAGIRWPYLEDPETVCPDRRHTVYDADRCRFCGAALPPPAMRIMRGRFRQTFCSSRHRVYALRARRRVAA